MPRIGYAAFTPVSYTHLDVYKRQPRDNVIFQSDMRAYDLWCLGAGLRPGLGYRQGVVLVD